MNAGGLLAHYERIADTPDAILRLRRFILDLAVRGKLVPQDPNDEPASALLKGIAKEKVSQADLPEGWRRATVGSLLNFQYGKGLKASERAEKGPVPVFGSNGIVGFTDEPLTVHPSIIVGRKGSAGALNLCDGPSWTTDVAYFVEAPEFFEIRFLLSALTALDLDKLAKGVKPGLSRSDAYEQFLCIPPLAEQNRIVAKVDELMILCDRLEETRKAREATRDKLTAASLARLNTPDAETFHDDARLALDALPALTARPDQIKQLRQTILNLAVRGKLVPQDPNDEPVTIPTSACDETPAEIPSRWRYTRLSNLLAEETRNGYSRKPDDAPGGTPILRISAGTVRRDGVVAEEEHKLISGIDAETRVLYGLKPGNLLACRFNGNKAFVGRLTIFNDYLGIGPIYPDKLIRVRVTPRLVAPAFLRLAGDTDLVRAEVEAACATTVGNWGISASNLKEIRFPLPPLGEQHRIVAKVDELMTVCDQLEASLTTADDTRRRLLEALLAGALSPALTIDREAAE
jgi:type I restriction enzyme S subunit